MSTDNAARFYWGKLQRALDIFEKGNTELAQDICCQLGNEFRCPRFCQVEAWKLRSRCYPDNYWFAKSSLDHALEICVSCESYDKATERDLEALADVKKGIETMLRNRLTEYRAHWKAKGREPPSQDEWYEIAEAEDGDSGGEWYEVAVDEEGIPLSGPVEPLPPKEFVSSSASVGKTVPPKAEEMQKPEEQERQCGEEQNKQDIKAVNIATKEGLQAVDEVAQELRQL